MINSKDTNPKDAVGIRKVGISSIPIRILWNLGLAMMEGALKYGLRNYRASGVRYSVYFDAAVARHIFPWWEGQDIDPDSGEHHLVKAITALCVLYDSIVQGNAEDDRPPTQALDMNVYNEKAAALIEKYGHIKPRHWTIKDNEEIASMNQEPK